MSFRKRHIESIDLTGDEGVFSSSSQGYINSQQSQSPYRNPKQARTSYGSQAGSSQAEPLLIYDEEEDGSEEVPDAIQAHTDSEYSYALYGVLHTKIVGVRYYDGYATIDELIILRREPHNQYDSNAIQALNVQGAQIGHIPRAHASKLAKHMDNRSILLEAVITGHKGAFDCPIQINLYGTNEPAERENLMIQLQRDGLPVGHIKDRQRKEERARKEREKIAKEAAKQAQKQGRAVVDVERVQTAPGMSEFTGGSSQSTGLNPLSMDDIIGGSERFNPRNVDQIVEQFGVKEDDLAAMPKAQQPTTLETQLHDFQLQGLQWMLDKEAPQLPAAGTKDVIQLWKRHPTVPDAFTNLATNFSLKDPQLMSGGILADDMGLGKTIQIISLIMADRELGRRASNTCDATLILAPVSVMSNWSTQIARHIKDEHALRVMFYHGTRKQPINPTEIQKYDVVISTYDSISSEWHSQKSMALPRHSGVFSVKWRRVILDEGHNIRNPKAKKSVAASNLMAQSRWTLTGTPIINTLKDLYALTRFLRLSGGLDRFDVFHGALIRPVQQGDARGNKALQLLMGGICLRRKKEMKFIDLRLPELSEYVHKITLLPHEQEKYNGLEAQAKGTLDMYRSELKGGKGVQDTYRHLLEVLLRMRQLCNHWKLVGEERLDSVLKQLAAEGVVDLSEENKVALQKILQLAIDSQEDCPVCFETLQDSVITKCGHIFCTPCIERVIEMQHKCPMCRNELETYASTCVKPAQETSAPVQLTQDQLKVRYFHVFIF
jgi:SWI/SNF-related matrix-associated actin-dependent regulator of chromatin subfamily A3